MSERFKGSRFSFLIFALVLTQTACVPSPPSADLKPESHVLDGASAKRAAPVPVAPVRAFGVLYSPRHFIREDADGEYNGGSIEATDEKSGELIWNKVVYRYVVDPALERDVQDVFIRTLNIEADALRIIDEAGAVYYLPLARLK